MKAKRPRTPAQLANDARLRNGAAFKRRGELLEALPRRVRQDGVTLVGGTLFRTGVRKGADRTEKQKAHDEKFRQMHADQLARRRQEKLDAVPLAVNRPGGRTVEEEIEFQETLLHNKFVFWKPYPTQMKFFELTRGKREALLSASNQYGKTTAGAYIATCHLTGRYPDWWPGRRFNKPTLGWIGGLSGIAVRDAAQTKLLGTPGDPSALGTGMVPKDLIVGKPNASRSAPNGIDSFLVKHITGGNSRGVFKTFEQGAGFWQGPTIDWAWLDEESPIDVVDECVMRLTGDGHIFYTLSPLLGRSLFIRRFPSVPGAAFGDDLGPQQLADRGTLVADLSEAEHFSEEDKGRRRASMSEHERSAREHGIPTMGEGSVFSTPEQDLRIAMNLGGVPEEWRKLWSLDFGGSSISGHAFGAVLWAFDLENDVDYILHCIKMTTPPGIPAILSHCDAMKRIAAMVPVAWPHDGHVTRDGEAMADLYKGHGLLMLPEHAQFASGGYGTQPGIDALAQRMQQRKLLIRNCPENEKWFEEYRAYHYKDDKVVKEFDDLMSATRIGYIYKRKARAGPLGPGGEAKKRAPMAVPAFDLFTGEPLPMEA